MQKERYPYHGLAIGLINVAQISSSSVESFFSKLEHIRRTTGDGTKEYLLEVRLLLQID